MGFWSDLKLAFKESKYLPLLAVPSPDDKFIIYPEYSIKDLEESKAPTLWQIIRAHWKGCDDCPELWTDVISHNSVNPAAIDDEIEYVFINGIQTNRDMLHLNGLALSFVFGRPITVMHNPTYGIVMDLAESIFGRTFDANNDITLRMANHIVGKIQQGKTIRLIGHSQGAIIAGNVVRMLSEAFDDTKFANKVELYTFAGALDELDRDDGTIAEHFANEFDFVARIGVMALDRDIYGETYVRPDATGHMLNMNYLDAFVQGKYCGGQSRLHGFIEGRASRAIMYKNKQRLN